MYGLGTVFAMPISYSLNNIGLNKLKVLKILFLKWKKRENNSEKCHWILQEAQIRTLKNTNQKLCSFGECLVFYIWKTKK